MLNVEAKQTKLRDFSQLIASNLGEIEPGEAVIISGVPHADGSPRLLTRLTDAQNQSYVDWCRAHGYADWT